MEIKSLLKLIRRYKWVLIMVPIVAVAVTYHFAKNLPQQYSSKVQISTGLVDPSKQIGSKDGMDFFKISQHFSNIIEKLKAKKTIDRLSLNLLAHDLEVPKHAFRKPSKSLDSLGDLERTSLLQLVKDKLLSGSILTPADNNGPFRMYDLINTMEYGEDNLSKMIEVSHVENSDFININFVSENPELSAFAVNNLATEFISTYSTDVNMNQNSSIALLDSLMKRKERIMDQKNAALSNFKRNKGVLNLDEQSANVYSQISMYEAQRAQAMREIQSNQAAILIIEGKLRGNDPFVRGSSRADNQEIVRLKRQLELANSNLIDRNFNPIDQRKVDSLTRAISQKGAQNSDENALDPKTSRQGLVQQKLALEIALQQAKGSIASLDNQLKLLRARYQNMVPFDADIQNYEREATLATKDYTAALEQYNNSRMQQNMGVKFQIEEAGLPGEPEPSKLGLYVGAAGVSSFLICFGVIFLLFLADKSIISANQLETLTKSEILGTINFIHAGEKSLRTVWKNDERDKDYETFKDLLRSLRFEIGTRMDVSKSKILGITSLGDGVGKSFISYGLAYSFAMTGKKVLLISESYPIEKVGTKELTTMNQDFQSFLIKKEVVVEDLITIMNKTSGKGSLFELQNITNLRNGFEILKKEFDIIIIDINSLQHMNIAKEWLLFAERTISVFESGNVLKEYDSKNLHYINDHEGFMGWVLNKYNVEKAS